jgi:PadR family transcriptional regulator, regulatory protein PadR
MKSEFLINWHSQLRKGLLPLFVLMVLREKENYGYELIQNLQTRFAIDVAEGTLYPLLVRLQKEGLLDSKWVEQVSGIPRKYYVITPVGEQTLHEMRAYMDSLRNINQEEQ